MFRAYYLCGGLLTAALLGTGSLLGIGVRARRADRAGLHRARGRRCAGRADPRNDRRHGDTRGAGAPEPLPCPGARDRRNAAGSLALIGVAVAGLRRRPVGNALLLAGFAVAAAGSALAGLGAAETAVFVALGAGLLYAGSVVRV